MSKEGLVFRPFMLNKSYKAPTNGCIYQFIFWFFDRVTFVLLTNVSINR